MVGVVKLSRREGELTAIGFKEREGQPREREGVGVGL